MRPRTRAYWTALFAAALSFQSAAKDDGLSAFASQLTELIEKFGKLNEAVANQMKANERYLMAKDMLRLSSGFYALMSEKDKFVDAVKRSPPGGAIEYSSFLPAVRGLKKAVLCFSDKFTEIAPRLGALSEVNGVELEKDLREGLDEKAESLNKVAKDLGLNPQQDQDVKALLIADSETAEKVAEQLYEMTAKFAHTLDPSVIMPSRSELCSDLPPSTLRIYP